MAIASSPAGPVLAEPVLKFTFVTAHAQMINNAAIAEVVHAALRE